MQPIARLHVGWVISSSCAVALGHEPILGLPLVPPPSGEECYRQWDWKQIWHELEWMALRTQIDGVMMLTARLQPQTDCRLPPTRHLQPPARNPLPMT